MKNLEISKRLEDTYNEKWLPWKKGVDKAAEAAENQEIVAALRKKHPDYDSNPTLKYRMAGLLRGAPDPRDYGGSDPINAVAALYSPYRRYHRYLKHYAELPHNDRGAYLKLSRGVQRFDVRPDPKNVPPGTYRLRIRAGAVKGSDRSRHFIEIGHPQKPNGTVPGFSKLLSTQPISGTIENPEIIEVNVEIGASTPREVGIQERQPKSAKLLRKEFDRHKQKNGYGTPPAIWVDWMELEGPIAEAAATESRIVRVEPEKTINPANEKEIAEIEDAYARFTRWQKGVDKAAKTPANQAKIAEIRKTEPRIDHPFLFYAFADRLHGAPDAKDFGFRDSNKAASAHPKRDRSNLAYHKHYAALPHRDRGTYLKLAYGTGWVTVAPRELPPGNYVIRVHVGAVKDTPAARRFIQIGHPQRLIPRNRGLEGRAISTHQVTGTIAQPETIEIPLTVGADTPREFAIQEKQPNTGKPQRTVECAQQMEAEKTVTAIRLLSGLTGSNSKARYQQRKRVRVLRYRRFSPNMHVTRSVREGSRRATSSKLARFSPTSPVLHFAKWNQRQNSSIDSLRSTKHVAKQVTPLPKRSARRSASFSPRRDSCIFNEPGKDSGSAPAE